MALGDGAHRAREAESHGGQRERFETKLFGGGRVIGGSLDIGKSNIDFVHRYLQDEQMKVAAEDVGGTLPRTARLHVGSGRVTITSAGQATEL